MFSNKNYPDGLISHSHMYIFSVTCVSACDPPKFSVYFLNFLKSLPIRNIILKHSSFIFLVMQGSPSISFDAFFSNSVTVGMSYKPRDFQLTAVTI